MLYGKLSRLTDEFTKQVGNIGYAIQCLICNVIRPCDIVLIDAFSHLVVY